MNLPHNRSEFFKLSNTQYTDFLYQFFDTDLKNDGKDITAHIFLDKTIQKTAKIISKEKGVLAGELELSFFLKNFFPHISFRWEKNDTDDFNTHEDIVFLNGNIYDLLKLERIFLNTLSRMSGIASTTKQIQEKINTPISATRKTPLSFLDKKSVIVGGGLSHRIGLFDAVMIKENHLLSLKNGIEDVISFFENNNIKNKNCDTFGHFFEIEVETETEFLRIFEFFYTHNVLNSIPKVIMLDNFEPKKIISVLNKIITPVERKQKNIFIEVSGGINSQNIQEYDTPLIDVISLSEITNSGNGKDFSMRIS